MPANLDGVLWLILSLAPLLVLQRTLQREVQMIFLLVTRRVDISITLFSVLFFPGVLLHEGSHFLMARVMGVHTGRFSLIPSPTGDGKLQLGFVETASVDWFRDALIGMAPLLTGGLFVAYAGLRQLQLLSLAQVFWSEGPQSFSRSLSLLITRPDFWLWFYITLVVSSTMLPSKSDRRAWLPLGLILVGLAGLALLFGAGPWMLENLASPFNQILRAIAIVFTISAVLHLSLLPFIWLVRRLLSRLLGLEVML